MRTTPSISQNRNEEPSWSLIRLVSPTGIRKNSTIANTSATTTVPAHTAFGISSARARGLGASGLRALVGAVLGAGGSCALAETSSARKPIASEPPSATTPRTIGRRSRRWRFSAESSGKVLTSISPSAASSGERSPSASCSAVGLRTATAQLETPRIITPSSTACPPTGASRRAFSWPCSSASTSPRPHRRALAAVGERVAAPSSTASSGVVSAVVVGEPARREDIGLLGGPSSGPGGPWRRGAGSARRARRCPSASADPCRTGGSSSTPRRAAPPAWRE